MSTPHYTPGVVAFYRGKEHRSAAVQFRLYGSTPERTGHVRMDITDGPTQFQYDWNKKISMNLTTIELAAIARLHQAPVILTREHTTSDPAANAKSKRFALKPAPRGGAFLDVTETVKGQTREHSISLNDDELFLLKQLAIAALPITIGWTTNLCLKVTERDAA